MNLHTFLKLRNIQDDLSLTEAERARLLIAVFKDIPVDRLDDVSVREFESMAAEVAEEINLLTEKIEAKETYEIDGCECRFIRKAEQMSAVQFSDLLTILSQGEIEPGLAIIASIVLVPVGTTYPDYNRLALEAAIADKMNVRDILAIAGELEGLSMTSRGDMLTSLVLTRLTAWIGAPRWRRSLARMIIRILLRPRVGSGSNGRGKYGLTKLRRSRAAAGGRRPNGLG